MVEKQSEKWLQGPALPGLVGPARWQAQQIGAGVPGRKTGVLLRLTTGDLPGFLKLWDAYAHAVIEQGGLPSPRSTREVPVSDKELANGIAPQAAFVRPEPRDPYAQRSALPDDEPPEEQVFSLIVGRGFFGLLYSDIRIEGLTDPREQIASLIIGTDLPEGSVADATEDALAEPLADAAEPEGVITAVIDGGLPLAHARFRKSQTQTRIEYAWLQDVQHAGGGFVGNGRELDKADIDAFLGQCLIGDQIDEDRFYRLTGQADYADPDHTELGYAVTHGAHVMDLAAGRDWSDPLAQDKNPIICVQLPNPITADTSGASLEVYVAKAFRYIRQRALKIAIDRGSKPMPIVVNFSYGFIAGPHDGHAALELVMDKFIKTYPGPAGNAAVILPSGNRYLSQCHAVLTPDSFAQPGNKTSLTWRLQPDDQTESFVEFWMPKSNAAPGSSRLSMTVTPPGGPTSNVIAEIDGDAWVWKPSGPGGQVVCEISYAWHGAPIKRGVFTIAVQRTADFDPTLETAPSGDWIIEIEDTGLAPGDTVNGWIQRDDAIFSDYARGRQSYFIDGDYEVFNPAGTTPIGDFSQTDNPASPIRKAGLQNAIATGDRTVTIGGMMMKNGQPALYSAGGPTSNPAKDAPDALATSDTSRVHFGTIAAGSRSGSVAVLNGTSVSTPRLARRVAEAMAAGQKIERAEVAAWAVADEAGHFANRPPPPTPERSANGRLVAPTGRDLKRIEFP